ncbi:unnamed protein product [Linum trigynum]|uniref:Uncharacterized protein n=1 Tax=Linum trigynum TaxID=586398 RepID=A0AAV2D9M8_9ROSI
MVVRSSAKSEYIVLMASNVNKLIWLRWLLQELGVPLSRSTPLYCDNQAALHVAADLVFHERTKNMKIDRYFVREHFASGAILPLKVISYQQVVDLFIKGLGADRFRFILFKLNVRYIHRPT